MSTQTCVAKMTGFDIELGNYIEGLELANGTGREASLALRAAFEGVSPPRTWTGGTGGTNGVAPQSWNAAGGWYGNGWSSAWYGGAGTQPSTYSTDWGRKWLASNGACCYIDLNHLEICGAEVLSARDHVAMWHAMLLKVREARRRVNDVLPAGQRVEVLANNSDGMGNSYGGHIDVLISRSCFENVLRRKVHLLSLLAAHQASSIVYTGQGKVGAENGQDDVDYQLSQRADFVEQLLAQQTTFQRPLVNTRDESLCGSWHAQDDDASELARLHVISYDTTLCHTATFLKVGTLQLVLCMLENEAVDGTLILDDPVDAIGQWSHGDLDTVVPLASGQNYSAIDVQEAILEVTAAFVADGGAEGLVPEAELIVQIWTDTLRLLRQKDLHGLARHCDWALKLLALDRAMTRYQKDWNSPEIKMLDHRYSSIDLNQGLYWQYARSGFAEALVSDGDIERAAAEPPEDTRAWVRAHLLRRAPRGTIDAVNWDSMRFRDAGRRGYASRALPMHNPLRFTRAECRAALDKASTFGDVLDALGADAAATSTVQGAVPCSGTRVSYDQRAPLGQAARLLPVRCGAGPVATSRPVAAAAKKQRASGRRG